MNTDTKIIIEEWKLPIFLQHLNKAGFAFKEEPGCKNGTYLLSIEAKISQKLGRTIFEASKECEKNKHNSVIVPRGQLYKQGRSAGNRYNQDIK